MNCMRFIFFVCAAGSAAVFTLSAQTTNFTPRPPARSYDARAQIYYVPLRAFVAERDDIKNHLYLPKFGGDSAIQILNPMGDSPQPVVNRTREKQEDDDEEVKAPNAREILAGADERQRKTGGWDGFAGTVTKQRLASRKAQADKSNIDSRGQKDSGNDPAPDQQEGALKIAGNHAGSLWRQSGMNAAGGRNSGSLQSSTIDTDAAGKFMAGVADARRDYAAMPGDYSGRGAPDDLVTRGVPAGFDSIGGAGNSAVHNSPHDDQPVMNKFGEASMFSSQWKSGNDAFAPSASPFAGRGDLFSSQQAPQHNASLFSANGDSLFPRDDSGARQSSPTPASSPFDDIKKPSILPW